MLDTVAAPSSATRAEALGRGARAAPATASPTRVPTIGETRGLGPMRALELVRDREPETPAPELVAGAIAAARPRACCCSRAALYGNVLRLLPPLTIADDDLERGLELLEAAFDDAAAGPAQT